MKCFLKLFLFTIIFFVNINLINSSFINPYPKFQAHNDNGDPGEPLYLTDLIKSGKVEEARNLAKVDETVFNSWFTSYSGYLTVDKHFNSNTFFWYFPAETNPEVAPVVLWLQGGPGASSLFGLFTENGPVSVNVNGALKKRKYSWSRNHHLIFIDNPVGTGYSFTDSDDGYAKNEKDVGRMLFDALQQFFTLFPNLQKLDFWVTGESYAGKYVPAVAYKIHQEKLKKNTSNININMKGVAIGNGLSDPIHQLLYGDYLYQLGLIDVKGRDIFHEKEKIGKDCISKHDMDCAFNVFDELINMDQSSDGSVFKNLTGYEQYYNYLKPKPDDSDEGMGKFLQSSKTRKAIHVGNNTFHGLDGTINEVEVHLKLDVMDTVAPWVAELLKYYRVCIYNGQLDIIVAYPLTLNYLQKLKFDGADIYKNAPRYIWKIDNEIAGYAKEAGNLVEVLVRNAGHMVPSDQPKWAFDLITRLTNNKGFKNDS